MQSSYSFPAGEELLADRMVVPKHCPSSWWPLQGARSRNAPYLFSAGILYPASLVLGVLSSIAIMLIYLLFCFLPLPFNNKLVAWGPSSVSHRNISQCMIECMINENCPCSAQCGAWPTGCKSQWAREWMTAGITQQLMVMAAPSVHSEVKGGPG